MLVIASTGDPSARPRILFVEDEASISEPFSGRSERAGFDPTVVAHGKRGVRIAEASKPDLVLLDLNLPDGDGLDVCRALQRALTYRS